MSKPTTKLVTQGSFVITSVSIISNDLFEFQQTSAKLQTSKATNLSPDLSQFTY